MRRTGNTAIVTVGLLAGVVTAVTMSSFAGVARSAAALVLVYAFGYVTGSLLVEPRSDRASLSLGTVRLVAGLFLTSIAFLLCLRLSLPWIAGPAGLFALAVILHRRAAFVPPRPNLTFRRDGALAGLVALVVLGPTMIEGIRMAPGEFPPVFFNVDTPYFLEKVHTLIRNDSFPPESLSVADGRRAYHFGIHALAALISRGSGIAAHHSVFLIVVPLLSAGIVAAAIVLARALSPTLPSLVAVPLLLISVPTLWYDFWNSVGPGLWDAARSLWFHPIDSLTVNWQVWGVTSNIQNFGARFIVLASLAGVAIAPSAGWQLPVFLIGSAIIFKAPLGVALVAGFSVAQAYRAATARSLRPVIPAVAAAAVFGALYGAFWIRPGTPGEVSTELFPLFYLRDLSAHSALLGFVLDVAWLLLPALILLPAGLRDRDKRSLPLLFFAIAPFIVVNVMRSVDMRRGAGISAVDPDDWLKIMLPVPVLIHAFVLSVVGQRWARLGTGFRAVFLAVVVLAILPPVLVAARYAHILIVDPERGHEFVDNHSLAEALAVIPTEGSIIVTNDLRYPAEGFGRENRQMQIPALFGHQAFAVNYAYEIYPFSRQRLELQKLLESEQWTDAIDQAAHTYHWTHLIIRQDYAHPDPIPLEQIFDNGLYSVFRFGPTWPRRPGQATVNGKVNSEHELRIQN
jgi:hypothetical protein